MRNSVSRALVLALAAMPAAWGQFQLYLVSGTTEQPVAPVYNIGPVEPGLSASVAFRIRNTGNTTALLTLLSVAGSGFTLTGGPSLPATLAPGQSVDFTVVFQSAGTGSYSASLDATGISVLLTATVPVELTCLLDTGSGTQPLGAATLDFGTVQEGSATTRHVTLLNQTSVLLTVPAIQTTGAGFSLSGPVPAGTVLQPLQSAGFDVQFSPAAAGTASGSLLVGSRSYLLSGTGVAPMLPAPRLSVALAQPASAQQGTVTVNLSQASAASGSGTVTLAFQPAVPGATDPAIAFANGGQTTNFTVSAGDTQGHFGAQTSVAFQTGSTAGSLIISVQLGGQTDQQTIGIAPAAIGVTATQATRGTGTIEVDISGFDNTRTAGNVTFTFFDANGNPIAPGAMQINSAAAFAGYFQNSAGGTFLLKAVFPITGDATQIKAFEADLSNSAGITRGPETNF
jgi:hypothetical protein